MKYISEEDLLKAKVLGHLPAKTLTSIAKKMLGDVGEIYVEDEDDFEDFIDDGTSERIVSIEDLEKLMQNAIENEEYEIAAELRDRIAKMKGNE